MLGLHSGRNIAILCPANRSNSHGKWVNMHQYPTWPPGRWRQWFLTQNQQTQPFNGSRKPVIEDEKNVLGRFLMDVSSDAIYQRQHRWSFHWRGTDGEVPDHWQLKLKCLPWKFGTETKEILWVTLADGTLRKARKWQRQIQLLKWSDDSLEKRTVPAGNCGLVYRTRSAPRHLALNASNTITRNRPGGWCEQRWTCNWSRASAHWTVQSQRKDELKVPDASTKATTGWTPQTQGRSPGNVMRMRANEGTSAPATPPPTKFSMRIPLYRRQPQLGHRRPRPVYHRKAA